MGFAHKAEKYKGFSSRTLLPLPPPSNSSPDGFFKKNKSFPSSFKLPFSCQKTYTAFPPCTAFNRAKNLVFARSDFFSLFFFFRCLLEFKVMFTYSVLHPVRRFPFSSNGLLIKTTPTAQAHDFSSSPHTHTALHLNSVGPQTYK